jgi:toxin ParE1/3/4
MLPIIWKETALDDLAEIIAHIAEKNPSAARKLQSRLKASVKPASAHPKIGRKGSVEGTREIVATATYILVYKEQGKAIEIVNIYHARQKYPA